MRTLCNWLLALVMLAGMVTVSGASSAVALGGEPPDIEHRLRAIPGMTLTDQVTWGNYRFFLLTYRQPIDHRRPHRGTFEQRLSILHRGEDRPTTFFTSGYGLHPVPSRSEPTRLIDGNQVSLEYRYFDSSRPDPTDWSKLDIWQAAMDQHRIYRALRRVYRENWISTGASKGGMAATYYRRFFPYDMDGTVAYVTPNDVHDAEDSAYDRFLSRVSTPQCRERLNAVQREALVRREEMTERYRDWATRTRSTFEVVGDLDRAYESTVLNLVWGFWQYHGEKECAGVPEPTATTAEIYDFVDDIGDFSAATDQGLEYFTPYYYQAATQLGAPDFRTPHLDGLLRYPDLRRSGSYVPGEIRVPRFQWRAMADIDRWVRHHGSRLLFVYGEQDPWSAEPFRLGRHTRDSRVFTAPGANHGASIAALAEGDRETATGMLLRWAGQADRSGTEQRRRWPSAPPGAVLDRRDAQLRMVPRLY